jgi:endonuclease YncB( thermonuclease family)
MTAYAIQTFGGGPLPPRPSSGNTIMVAGQGPVDRVRYDVVATLEALIAGVKVRCEVIERDRYGRQGLLAHVVDIGRMLVPAGVAYRRYSMDYVDAENEAKKAKRGMWRGTFVKPWEWARLVTAAAYAGPFYDRLDF